MRTLLNLIQLYYRPKASKLPNSTNEAEQKVQEALVLLELLPNSPNKVYASIDLAELEQPVDSSNFTSFQAQCSPHQLNDSQTEELLQKAVFIAQNIKDSRS